MDKFTPGPWKVGTQDKPIGYVPIYARVGVTKLACICKTDAHEVGFGISEKELKANARLIAAAPELLEALEKADEFIANGIALGFIRMPDADVPDPAHETPLIIRAAISKATGGD